MLQLRNFDPNTDHNGPCESFFSLLKNIEYKGMLQLWLPTFVKNQAEMVYGSYDR